MTDTTKLTELLRAASVKGGMCDVAADMIEQQAARIAICMEDLGELNTRNHELLARIAELEKDAARYRWLRDPENAEGPNMVASSDPEELDAAIDAALAASEPKKD